MEVCETSANQPEKSESMDFSLTPETENVKRTVETEPMNATNPKPLYSYRLVDS